MKPSLARVSPTSLLCCVSRPGCGNSTAGDALNFHPYLHDCIADGLFHSDGTFVPFGNMNEEALNKRFGELCDNGFLKECLIEESDAAQILSQEHTGFSVWLGEPFQDSESAKFVARLVPHSFSDGGYIERGPLSLERLTVTDVNRGSWAHCRYKKYLYEHRKPLSKSQTNQPRSWYSKLNPYKH